MRAQHRSEWLAWREMRKRCSNPNRRDYGRYGGRGIRVCPRWLRSFDAFLADMGPKPTPNHSLDRIDNNGPYSPENCRWATRTEQMRNTRTNRIVSLGGVSLPLAAWCERFGLKDNTVSHRRARGWDIERALTTPVVTRARKAA